MVDKTALRDMLNHMINGNEAEAVAAFKEYLPLKTREIMGYSREAEPTAEAETEVEVAAIDVATENLPDSENPET